MKATKDAGLRVGLMASVMLLGGCLTLDPYQVAREQKQKERWLGTPVDVPVQAPAFDEKQARKQLVAGNARIQGGLYHRIVRHGRDAGVEDGLLGVGSNEQSAANIRVWLMPLTDHVQQWLQLDEKNRQDRNGFFTSNNTRIENHIPHPKVFRQAWMARTDASGNFVISGVGPGRYALVSDDISIYTMRRKDHHVGTDYQASGYMQNGHTVTPVGGTVAHVESTYQRMRTVVRFRKVLEVADRQVIDLGRERMWVR